MSKNEELVGTVPEIMEPSNAVPSLEVDESRTTMDSSDVIIITVPTTPSSESIFVEDAVEEVETLEVVRHDTLLSPPSKTDTDSECDYLSYYSPADSQSFSDSISLHSPSSDKNCTDFTDSYSDMGYESLDSPPSENLKLLFPELM